MKKARHLTQVLIGSCCFALTLLTLAPQTAIASAGFSSAPVPIGPLDFGQGPVGTSNRLRFSVSETGDSTLTLSSLVLGGASPGVFSVQTVFPISIVDGGRAHSIELVCTPPATGTFSAMFRFVTNDPIYPLVQYKLLCTGTEEASAPSFSATPEPPGSIVFGTGPVGFTNRQTLFVAEKGTATLTLANPVLGGQDPSAYSLTTVFPIDIEDGGGRLGITVTCTPSLGEHAATLQFTTNDPANPIVVFDLLCTGAYLGAIAGLSSSPAPPGPISIEPAPIGLNSARLIQVSEVGSADLVLRNPWLTGEDPGYFFVPVVFPLTILEGSWGKSLKVGCKTQVPGTLRVPNTGNPAMPAAADSGG